MTTALKSLYIQIEMPTRTRRSATAARRRPGSSTTSGNADIPIEQAISTHDVQRRGAGVRQRHRLRRELPRRRDGARRRPTFTGLRRCSSSACSGSRRASRSRANPTCCEHASKPYFTTSDLTDWAWVTINHKATPADRTPAIQPYDLPALRDGDDADAVAAARRLLHDAGVPGAVEHQRQQPAPRDREPDAAGRRSGSRSPSDRSIVPLSQRRASTATHAVAGTECVGCHKSLDPMRQFWGNQLDFNDRNDFPAGNRFTGGGGQPAARRRPGGVLRVRRRQRDRAPTSRRWGRCWRRSRTAVRRRHRFAIAIAQELCFCANSAPCSETDAEFRRVVSRVREQHADAYNFAALIKELFASPLVTGAMATGTYRERERGAGQHRAARPALRGAVEPAGQARPVRAGGAGAAARRRPRPRRSRSSVAADAFSRGSRDPGHAVGSDAVLPVGQRAAVRERRGAGRRPDQRAAASTPCSDVAGRDRRTWSRR